MKQDLRVKRVRFATEGLFATYQKLKTGTFEEKKIAESLDNLIAELKQNPLCGTKIPRRLWPKEYLWKYCINNLFKYDLPDGWRVMYTLVGNETEVSSVLLEWFTHKDYEKRFGYKTN